jgi:capsular polysaccharide transport system permease protein
VAETPSELPSAYSVPPPVRPAFMRPRHWMLIITFVICVIVPTVLAGVYLYTRAADQYASRVGFSVRSEETGSAFEFLGSLTNVSGSSSSDTDILYKFIQSQELVEAVDAALDLHAIWGKPADDPYFTLAPDSSLEDLLDYWEDMVRVIYDPGTGLIEVEVRAFDPQDARRIGQDLLERSSAMINELSTVARTDVTRYAREELDQAIQRLKDARQAMTLFRNETQIVDPGADIQGQMGLLSSLQLKLAETLIELDILTQTVRPNDPRIEQTRRETLVIQKRIDQERRKLGVSGDDDVKVFADLVGQFEVLSVDLKFAEQAYISALSAYDTAVAEARRQSRYLAAYLHPTLAETPEYPQREILLAVLSLILFGSWSILMLVIYSLKDRK